MSDYHLSHSPSQSNEHSIPNQTLESQIPNENPSSPASSPSQFEIEEWESKARSWLSTLSKRRNVSMNEIEAWIVTNQVPLPQQLESLPRPQIYQRIASIHKQMRRKPNQVKEGGGNSVGAIHARFQRTDQWLPVYSWLESLDKVEVVKSKEISDWLSENPTVNETLYSRHSRYHLMHYIQKCHMKILKRRGVLQKGSSSGAKVGFRSQEIKPISMIAAPNVVNQPMLQICSSTNSMKALSNDLVQSSKTTSQPMCIDMAVTPPSTTVASVNRLMQSSTAKVEPVILNNGVARLTLPSNFSGKLKSSDRTAIKQDDALCKYELFTNLEAQLTSLLYGRKP